MSLHPLGPLLLQAQVHSMNVLFDAVSSTIPGFASTRSVLARCFARFAAIPSFSVVQFSPYLFISA